jgi:putative transposase
MSDDEPGSHERWAHLRFSVVGGLLASPPEKGSLRAELVRLASKSWCHPVTGQPVRFGVSTIERWYYAALRVQNPVTALRRKLREDGGGCQVITETLERALVRQRQEHPTWSYKLHLDNLAVLIGLDPTLGRLPSYATLRRVMTRRGMVRQPRRRRGQERPGELHAREIRESREVRSFESEYVSGLWHLDFHHASLGVLTPKSSLVHPVLLGILDDRSRLVCHAQWYLDETAESLIHGLGQAFLKRGLPRALMTDNGSAMVAAETTQGLARLCITHFTTLPYSPHQNGKQEVFWGAVAGRLMAMLEGQ